MLRDLMHAAGAELVKTSRPPCAMKTIPSFWTSLGGSYRIPDVQKSGPATGGKSIPKMGATGFAYDIATQIDAARKRAPPVPFTFSDGRFAEISGVSLPVRAQGAGVPDEAILFTHRACGSSHPANQQLLGRRADITPNLTPRHHHDRPARSALNQRSAQFQTELATYLPARLVDHLMRYLDLSGNLADWSDARLTALFDKLQNWSLRPSGPRIPHGRGYWRIATEEVSSNHDVQTVQDCTSGEAMDVTGWLGGYNFQWAGKWLAAARDI